ncbi:MAG: amidase [Hyphomicrobiales bacterium]|nr:amidase [Hyphomicrobiales bacterium]
MPLLASKECSGVEVRASCLENIGRLEPLVGAWQHLDFGCTLDASFAKRPFAGIPYCVKDTFDVMNLPAERGSPIYRGRIAREDAACVATLRSSGLFPLGKTVATEFAYFTPGKTANPHDLRRTPGGSSSGSAAAVASCMVPVALGSQTAASVIRPASFCGVVGFVATHGAFSLRGILPLAHSFDALGIIARSVKDVMLVYDSLAGIPFPSNTQKKKPRSLIAIDGTNFGPVDPQMLAAFSLALDQMRHEGIEIRLCRSTSFGKAWVETHKKLMAREAALTFASEHNLHGDQLSSHFLALIEEGRSVSATHYETMLADQARDKFELKQRLSECDGIITPAAPGTAPKGLNATGQPHLSRPWQLFGLPQCTLPCTVTDRSLPLGIQLIGNHNEDRNILSTASWLQDELGWTCLRPQVIARWPTIGSMGTVLS